MPNKAILVRVDYDSREISGVAQLKSKASVHDIHYVQDIKYEYHRCTLLGD